jgi:hypothetical protein
MTTLAAAVPPAALSTIIALREVLRVEAILHGFAAKLDLRQRSLPAINRPFHRAAEDREQVDTGQFAAVRRRCGAGAVPPGLPGGPKSFSGPRLISVVVDV